MAERLPFIAVIVLPDGCNIRYERTGKTRGHHTVWGDPEELLGYVSHVEPVHVF